MCQLVREAGVIVLGTTVQFWVAAGWEEMLEVCLHARLPRTAMLE